MKLFLVLILVIVSVGAQGMADPNFVPANSPEQVAPGADDMMDTTATLNQLDEQEKEEEDMKAAEEARKQAQEAADQQNYRDDVPSEEMLLQEEP